MAKNKELPLFSFVQSQETDVVHFPYTEAFESFCSQQKALSNKEKHELYERMLKIKLLSHITETPSKSKAPVQNSSLSILSSQPQFQKRETPIDDSTFPELLFKEATVEAEQPWTFSRKPETAPEIEGDRQRLLADIADKEFGTTEQRVGYLLQHFPETRNSDVALCIKYWRKFEARKIEEWNPIELEILYDLKRWTTIERVRREIQGKLQLFRGTEEIQKWRDLHQKELYEYLASHRKGLPEIRFYLDETGNEGDKRYAGVAGICIMNWTQYEKHFAALAQWRAEQQWPETIHFADTGNERLDRTVRLLAEVAKRRSGLLFVGYALESRSRTNEDFFSLFVHLIIDALKRLRDNGSLDEPRVLRVVKEAEPGFDNFYLAKMNAQLKDLVALEFPGLVLVEPIETRTKGRHVLLECADLIAGGMQRRALYKGRNPKDRLAEAVINVTGFDEAVDEGALFKFYPH